MKGIAVLLIALLVLSSCVCATAETSAGPGIKTWNSETIEHAGFKDLGNYVIELPDYTDPATAEKGMANINKCFGNGETSSGGCTCMMTTNSKGQVIAGRNMDIEISQFPAYVYKTTFGKYTNFGVTYDAAGEYLHYAEVQKLDDIDEEFKNGLIYRATDCINEMGLYVQTDQREADERFVNHGLHSAHGETTREDGTPWSELRMCIVSIPMIVTQNCATVEEAIAFLNNSYDWYSIRMPGHHFDQLNFCFMIGDATGKYGLIEIAQDEINFLPYQFGQANYYITPKWNALDTRGIGVGRLAKANEMVIGLETLDEAMEAMKSIMWRNETLWIGESVRADDDQH